MFGTPFEMAELLATFHIAKLMCINRVKIVIPEAEINTFPNMYCTLFGESGAGKNTTKEMMDSLSSFLISDMDKMEEDFRIDEEKKLIDEADLKGMKDAKQKAYADERMPRSMYSQIDSNSTPEGLSSVHEVLDKAGFGAITWYETEVTGMMLRNKPGSQLSILTDLFIDAYDNGKLKNKIIKGEKKTKKYDVVPYMAWLHGALDDEHGKEPFKNLLTTGLARRAVFCMLKPEKPDHRTKEQIKADQKAALAEKDFIKKNLEDIYVRTKCALKYGKNSGHRYKELHLEDEETLDYFNEMVREYKNKALSLPQKTSRIIKNELAGRWWKILKVSAVFAVQNHNDLVIKISDLEQAKSAMDEYGEDLGKFLGLRVQSELTIAEQMLESLETGPMKTTDFYKQSYFPKHRSGQPALFKENIELVKDMLSGTEKMLHEEKPDKRTTIYELITIPEHDKEPSVSNIRLSVGASAELTCTDFEAVEVPFNELHKITGGAVAYAPGIFRGNKIGNKNWMGGNDLLMIDIDNDRDEDDVLTIDTARTKFSAFTHLICTTKSHQKEKKGIVADRFRIILPCTYTKLDIDGYKKIMESIIEQYGLANYCDKQATMDAARKYMPNASQQYWYNEGWLMNPLIYYYETDGGGEVKRPFPVGQIVKVRGRTLGLNELIQEARGKSKPIPCFAFCHDDKTPSAFFCINRDGNFQYTCTSCGISLFHKLK